jgi:hypothetical protein
MSTIGAKLALMFCDLLAPTPRQPAANPVAVAENLR